jgi:hypothetical protein
MPANASISNDSGVNSYISTWAFGLVASLEQMQKIRFYSNDEVVDRFKDNCFPYLPNDYKNFLNNWLQPTNLLNGWYKAIPGTPLEECIFIRKSLTIYLEHSLPRKLALQGFSTVDISEVLPLPKATLINILRIIDRLNINYLKLKLRLPVILRTLIK